MRIPLLISVGLFFAACQTTSTNSSLVDRASSSQNPIFSLPGPSGDRVRLPYRFFPSNKEGRRPAVVLLHGCGGLHGDNITRWASWYNSRGIHALALDSFAGRGLRYICGASGSWEASPLLPWERVRDPFGAAEWLRDRDDVDPEAVLVSGFSHGGGTTLSAVIKGWAPPDLNEEDLFRAGIALYPHCGSFTYPVRPTVTPTIIISGTEDTWTPISLCRRLEQSIDNPKQLRTFGIEGAYHSFDLFTWKGRKVKPLYYEQGHELGPSQEGLAEAQEIVERFLQELNIL